MTRDFSQRTRERIAETRATLTKFRAQSGEAFKQIMKISKQQAADRTRLYEKIGALAEDIVDKLPEEATDDDAYQARSLQDQLNDLASEVDEIALSEDATQDLKSMLDEAIRETYDRLKETEIQLSKMERLGAKLRI